MIPSRDNPEIPKESLITLLQQRLPGLLAVYAFGSRIESQGLSARSDSDLDLAVFLEGYGDPLTLFNLSGSFADIAACALDLLDIRAASTVMQHHILTLGTA